MPGIQKLQVTKKTLILYHGNELVNPPTNEMVILQMLNVAAGLLSLSNLSCFHTADISSTGLPE